MSVILTGMDMPDDCKKCDLCTTDACNGIDWNTKSIDFSIIPKNCPLKSVDRLIGQIEQSKHQRALDDDDLTFYQDGLDDAIAIIKEYCGMEEK